MIRLIVYLCPFCEHGQFFKGQHSAKDPCTQYVISLALSAAVLVNHVDH